MAGDCNLLLSFNFRGLLVTPCDNEGVKTVGTYQSLEILSVIPTPDPGTDDHTSAHEFYSLTALGDVLINLFLALAQPCFLNVGVKKLLLLHTHD